MFALASAFFDLMEKEIKESNRRTEDNSLWQPIQQLKDQKELFPILFVDSCVPIRVFVIEQVIEQNSGTSVARAPIGQRFLF